MVRETSVSPANLIYPLFVMPGQGGRKEISSLPGCFHLSADEVRLATGLTLEAVRAAIAGIKAELPILLGVIPFGMIYGVLALGANNVSGVGVTLQGAGVTSLAGSRSISPGSPTRAP